MHVGARVAIAAGATAITGFGAWKLTEFANRRADEDHARLQDATADARQQWDAWKGRLEAEFPGGALPTPQDHERFKAFLQRNPAPSFVNVEHDEFTRVHLSAGSPVDPDLLPVEHQKSNGYPLAFGGMSALVGAGMVVQGIRAGGSSPLATLGLIAGGAAFGAMGVAGVAGGIHGFKVGEGTEGVNALRSEINGW